MDAFAAGLGAATKAFREAAKRTPYASELAEALTRALAATPEKWVVNRPEIDERLGRWLALPRTGGNQRPLAKAGDVLRIPYAGDGSRQIYARVLAADDTKRLCLVIHDLDAPPTGELAPDVIRAAPILAGPVHIDDVEIREGRWRIAGHGAAETSELPTYIRRIPDGAGGWRDAVVDYYEKEIEDTPKTRARASVRGAAPSVEKVVAAIRMLRGCVRPLSAYTDAVLSKRLA